ncbi:alkaline phosphatase D family protein [Barrientosiimonas endolithica]|uniref:PhoD-like phosphatase metallophosphatase domain-containing protein n=1 Tax=Barrientosiimonas endolithica TaxID=1535208 RepID=A0ABN6YN79_9MICO|nr:alkaline phosphatase D family protein [Barrientosiimonas endolithica]BDZ57440.1 hypothetical protein GCM10025872_10970 [Barrientosiimonas endolithica]
MPDLVLGPLLRHVGERTASVWVETADFCTVTVRAGEQSWSMRTFRVQDHHYALVQVDGLEPGSVQDYTVEIDGEQVWPLADSPYPPSRIATIERDKPTRLAFGSCRTSVPHDAEHTRTHGVDALRATAVHLANHPDSSHWPDMVAFLGDQVYADETSEEMRAYIEQRRGLEEPPGEELKDFEEYAHLYWLAWTDPANRWLLSTLPSVMIFDDHDVRDDWNTSDAWHEEMNATDWWHERLMGRSCRTGSSSTPATCRRRRWPRTRCGSACWRTRTPRSPTSSTSPRCCTTCRTRSTGTRSGTGSPSPSTSVTRGC